MPEFSLIARRGVGRCVIYRSIGPVGDP
jgi:hypothetical protein